MAYTAVWWRTPGEALTGQYISMVRVLYLWMNKTIYINVTSINSNISTSKNHLFAQETPYVSALGG